MKTCQSCGHGNADEMRFCLECGNPLPDAPIVFNISGGSQPGMGGPQTNPFGGPTNFGAPGFQQPQQPFSMVPPAKPRSNKKIYIAVAGIFALIFLVFMGVAGIVAYNLMKADEPIVKASPTPTSSPTASSSSTPKTSESATPKPDASKSTKSDGEPRATIGKIRADFNVKEGGRTGMRIFTTFTVYDLKGSDLYLALYFLEEDGTPLKTTNKRYASTDGDVAVFKELKPGFDETFYDGMDLFIPYDEFKLSKGKYDLKIDASVIYKGGGLVDHLDYFPFEYEKF